MSTRILPGPRRMRVGKISQKDFSSFLMSCLYYSCQDGWSGELCDKCITLPGCQRGRCKTHPLQCACDPGWVGPLCDCPICRDGNQSSSSSSLRHIVRFDSRLRHGPRLLRERGPDDGRVPVSSRLAGPQLHRVRPLPRVPGRGDMRRALGVRLPRRRRRRGLRRQLTQHSAQVLPPPHVSQVQERQQVLAEEEEGEG